MNTQHHQRFGRSLRNGHELKGRPVFVDYIGLHPLNKDEMAMAEKLREQFRASVGCGSKTPDTAAAPEKPLDPWFVVARKHRDKAAKKLKGKALMAAYLSLSEDLAAVQSLKQQEQVAFQNANRERDANFRANQDYVTKTWRADMEASTTRHQERMAGALKEKAAAVSAAHKLEKTLGQVTKERDDFRNRLTKLQGLLAPAVDLTAITLGHDLDKDTDEACGSQENLSIDRTITHMLDSGRFGLDGPAFVFKR